MTVPNTPVRGAPEELEAQGTVLFQIQAAATAIGSGTAAATDGFNGAQMVEIQKSGSGTATAIIEGSYDGSTWYAVGYQQVDGQSTLTRAASSFSVTANGFNHVYQILDIYAQVRLRIVTVTGAISLSATLYAVPL